jgi:hypothetical protein
MIIIKNRYIYTIHTHTHKTTGTVCESAIDIFDGSCAVTPTTAPFKVHGSKSLLLCEILMVLGIMSGSRTSASCAAFTVVKEKAAFA